MRFRSRPPRVLGAALLALAAGAAHARPDPPPRAPAAEARSGSASQGVLSLETGPSPVTLVGGQDFGLQGLTPEQQESE